MSYNTGMRPLPFFASLLLAAFARGQELAPYELPADVAARIRAITGEEPLRLLAGIASMNRGLRGRAEERWDALDRRARCALTRAGLRSADAEVAAGAAVKAAKNMWWLDSGEIKRAAAAGSARCNVENTPFSVGDFFDLFDAEDTARFLASPGPRPREVPQFFGPLHQRFGPEHAAQVELLARSDDALLRQDAERYLGLMRSRRLRYGHFLLSRPVEPAEWPVDFDPMADRLPYEPRKVALRPPGPGYHPVLAALLEDLFLSGRKFEAHELTFAWRWARDETPGEIDRGLLERLAGSERDEARRVAVAGLSALGGEIDAALLQCATGDLEHAVAPFLALGELARRGDADARERLAALAPQHALALAVLWQVDRPGAAAVLARVPLAHALEAADDGAFWGMPMAGIAGALVARAERLDAAELGRLLEDVPDARTPELLGRGVAALTAGNVEDMPLGVLELGGAAALAARLREILADERLERDAFESALGALARLDPDLLGDDTAVLALFDRCERLREEDRARLRLRLAAARGDAVRGRALARLDEELVPKSWESAGMLATAVAACGVDQRAAYGLFYNLARNVQSEELIAARDAMVGPLRRGDGAAAIAAALALDAIGLGHIDVWTLPDEVALPVLRRGLRERERGEYLDATGQLARHGDPAARAEIESAIARRLYGWIDVMDSHVLTDGKSLARVPLLLSQVDSNCCTFAVIATALERVFEVDAFVGESGAVTRPARLHAAWERHRDELRWSRIADRWLIAPR